MLMASHKGVTFQGGLGMPAMPTLVGSYNGTSLMDGLGLNPAAGIAGAGLGIVLLGTALGVGTTWWAFKASRDGSNLKPALIMNIVPLIGTLLMGVLAVGVVAGAVAD